MLEKQFIVVFKFFIKGVIKKTKNIYNSVFKFYNIQLISFKNM